MSKMKIGTKYIDYDTGYSRDSFLSQIGLSQRMGVFFYRFDLLNGAIHRLTNDERIKHGLKQLKFCPGLQQTATLHSEEMKKHNFFDHVNPYNNSLRTLGNRVAAVHDNMMDRMMIYGENIARYPTLKGYQSFTVCTINGIPHYYDIHDNETFPYTCLEYAKEVVDGWMNSPGHRQNILNPKFEYLGCGCSRIIQRYDGFSLLHYYLTQNFGG